MEKTLHFNLTSKENEYLYPNSYKIKKKKKIEYNVRYRKVEKKDEKSCK